MDARSFDADKLLAETGWLQRLVRGLVASASDADDVAQTVALAALEHRPANDRSLRGWLATVARHAIAAARRASVLRDARERRVALHESEPSTVDSVMRLELHERVLSAVKQLAEPFRSAIVMRYFEELDIAAIARRCDVPEGTVRTRLHRGLARLRARLESTSGETSADGSPRTVLAPWFAAGAADSKFALGLGVLAMKKSLAPALAAVLCAGTGYLLFQDDDPAPVAAHESIVEPEIPTIEARAPDVSSSERIAVAPPFSVEPAVVDEMPEITAPPVDPSPSGGLEEVRGRVVDLTGHGIVDALVSLRGAVTRSRVDGWFELPLREVESDLSEQHSGADALSVAAGRIRAIKFGYAPGHYDAPLAPETSRPAFPPLVVVTLGPTPPSISGRVVDDGGLPVAGAGVWIADPTFFAFDGSGQPILLESMLATGNDSTENAVDPWQRVESDTDGNFAIPCIADRTYRVEAMNMDTMCHVAMPDVPSGTRDLRLRLPTRRMLPLVSGRVVSLHGSPIEGARIRATRDAFSRPGGRWMESGAVGMTDAMGRFELRGVPADGVYLRIDGNEIEGVDFARGAEGIEVAAAGVVTDIVITVLREVSIRVELTNPQLADELAILDRDGSTLRVAFSDGAGSRSSSERWPLEEGKSPELRVRESAQFLVLYRANREVDRVSFDPVSDGVSVIRR